MVESRVKRTDRVIERVGQSLDWTIEIGSGRVGKKEMIETFRDQSPTPDQWIAQNQGRIVPDQAVLQGWSVAHEHGEEDQQDGKNLLQVEKAVDRITKLRV